MKITICISIITGSSPLSVETWSWCNEMTSRVLAREAKIGGPRCCKRNSRIAILEAIEFIETSLNKYSTDKLTKVELIKLDKLFKLNEKLSFDWGKNFE